MRRDLSLVVGAATGTTVEALGDRVHLALGADAAANELRDRVYLALHEGRVVELATGE